MDTTRYPVKLTGKNMQIQTSNAPADAVAKDLAQYIENVSPRTVVCFYAGGSALAVFENLKLSAEAKVRTILLAGDERVSGEATANNCLGLQSKLNNQAELTVIDSVAQPDETADSLAARLNSEFQKILFSAPDACIISIQGIGEDGHTASIFPGSEEWFRETYEHDSTYVPVPTKGLREHPRASVTPGFITAQIEKLFVYAAGQTKANVLKTLKDSESAVNELPAQLCKQHPDCTIYTDQTV